MKKARVHPILTPEQAEPFSWMEPITKTDKYDIASRIAIAGLDGWTGRLTAEQQRKIFGQPLFGKKKVTLDCTNGGRVHGYRDVCFGTDWDSFDFSFETIAETVNSGRKHLNW